ncbi:MAG: YhfC family intramembrane metalloprotease [Anaerolineales bacterium]|nr:YhfC family intramembrane metalloprotease [Anaerolineales bacterium]
MNLFAHVLNFSLMIVMPVGLGLYLVRNQKAPWRLFGIGTLTFILSQVFHIPFNQWVLTPLVTSLGLTLDQPGIQLALLGLFYGLSAGLFEEVTRYLGYRLWLKEDRDWRSALMYGAGHGGIESILLGALALYAFIQVVTLRGTDLNLVVDAGQVAVVQAQIETYWAMPWYQALLGALERLAAIPIQVSASVLVLQSFRRKNLMWLFLAVGWHTLVDAAAVFAIRTWNVYITEGIVLVFGVLSVVIILSLKSGDEHSPLEPHQGPLMLEEIQAVQPSEENLEDSRYF